MPSLSVKGNVSAKMVKCDKEKNWILPLYHLAYVTTFLGTTSTTTTITITTIITTTTGFTLFKVESYQQLTLR